ncbi:MAG: hypothetical protein KAR40_17595 [Candidatus Sabulitectum sp.]|nr:hypothetical protein [Candidatus Sabulitectum sp.]
MKVVILIHLLLASIALAISPEAECLCELGEQEIKNENWTLAISYFSNAIDMEPDYALAFYHRAVTRSNLGQNIAAIADLDRVIELVPEWAGGYYWRGRLHFWLANYEEAIPDLTRVIELGSGNSETQSMLLEAQSHIESASTGGKR